MAAYSRASFFLRVFLLSTALVVLSCKPANSLPAVEIIVTTPDGGKVISFNVEVAATPPARSKGLMFRRSLGEREGMLFLFPRPQVLSFWMKNTVIPLDMLFISPDWRVSGILDDVPPLNEEPRSIDKPTQFVLEFSAGTVKRYGIVEGSIVSVKGDLPPVQ